MVIFSQPYKIEPTIYRTRGEHANHYTTDVAWSWRNNERLIIDSIESNTTSYAVVHIGNELSLISATCLVSYIEVCVTRCGHFFKATYHCRQRAPIENVWSTSGYFKAVFLKQTRIIIVSIYKYTVYIMFWIMMFHDCYYYYIKVAVQAHQKFHFLSKYHLFLQCKIRIVYKL